MIVSRHIGIEITEISVLLEVLHLARQDGVSCPKEVGSREKKLRLTRVDWIKVQCWILKPWERKSV